MSGSTVPTLQNYRRSLHIQEVFAMTYYNYFSEDIVDLGTNIPASLKIISRNGNLSAFRF